jgi:hypothetical protein
MSERWIHFSREPLGELFVREQHPLPEYITPHDKPNGLWLSNEKDYGWQAWCEDNEFACGTYRFAQEITLADDANVLRLSHPEDLDDFTKTWGVPDSYSRSMGYLDGGISTERFGRLYGPAYAIDWLRVAESWDGVLITPYHYERRMNHQTSWYYGWDCASGCIWHPRAIARVGDPEPVAFKVSETSDEDAE